jgi:TolB-like protein/Flp pilus assembly protein TadD
MPEPLPKAVFLSYAREDTDAARRIAEALRAFGVEVWYDMSELRGGDDWDKKIRRQIKECALFMPVISSQSDQRGEGYFRLEWKLAVERTHLLAEGRPFLFPVVVDETTESAASVPEQFLKAQWTRLPGGEPTPQFVDQVKRLLQNPPKQATTAKPAPAAQRAAPAAPPKSGFPLWAAALLGIAVLALGAFVLFRPAAKAEPTPVVVAPPPAVKPPGPVVPVISEKSLAVLPFSNMSEEKDASAFFSDGIHEDILTNLALISELRVVSRTSVMQYRGTNKTIRQIGQELGVTYVLEGSVRRAGNKVRVTGQLIRAANDEHVWAKAYDRELSDIFAIQEALATEIAGALKAAITPQQKSIIAGRASTSVEAYNNYLKAREIMLWSDVNRVTLPDLERLLQGAVQLDPNFVLAWLEISRMKFRTYTSPSIGGDRNQLAAGQAALAQAIRIAPEDPAVIQAQGRSAEASGDLTAARGFYERALQLAPGNVEFLIALGRLASDERRWADAMGYHRRAQALDPRNPIVIWNSYNALINLRQYDQAVLNARLLVELQPDSLDAAIALAAVPFLSKGSRTEMEAFFARLTPEQQLDPKIITAKFNWYYHLIGDAPAYLALHEQQGTDKNFSDEDSTLQYAQALIATGQRERAVALVRPALDRIKLQLANDPGNDSFLTSLAYAQALVGEHDAAKATVEKLLAKVQPGGPVRRLFFIQANSAIIYAWMGEKDKAVDLMQPMMRVPVGVTSSTVALRHDIDYSPLQGFPRWEALLADPASSRPFDF